MPTLKPAYAFDAAKAKTIWIGGPFGNAVVYLGHVGDIWLFYDLDAGQLAVGFEPAEASRLAEIDDYEDALMRVDGPMRDELAMARHADAAYDAISAHLNSF